VDIEWIRRFCLALPHATEHIQWEIDLVFKVGGKMFAVVPTEPARVCMSFKCSDDEFAELIERPGIIPAPYMARAKWVALECDDALSRAEIERLLVSAHGIVLSKLPKKLQAGLGRDRPSKPRRATQKRKGR
jgi:predicted DNA-binding protein (MmcQ/YjbR family)